MTALDSATVAQLPPTGDELSFSLTPVLGSDTSDRNDPFRNQYQVLATSFTIAFADIAAKSGALTLSLNHSGREVQVGTKGKTAFLAPATHAPRDTPFKIDYADPNSRSGGLFNDHWSIASASNHRGAADRHAHRSAATGPTLGGRLPIPRGFPGSPGC